MVRFLYSMISSPNSARLCLSILMMSITSAVGTLSALSASTSDASLVFDPSPAVSKPTASLTRTVADLNQPVPVHHGDGADFDIGADDERLLALVDDDFGVDLRRIDARVEQQRGKQGRVVGIRAGDGDLDLDLVDRPGDPCPCCRCRRSRGCWLIACSSSPSSRNWRGPCSSPGSACRLLTNYSQSSVPPGSRAECGPFAGGRRRRSRPGPWRGHTPFCRPAAGRTARSASAGRLRGSWR